MSAPNQASEPLIAAPVTNLTLPRTWCVVVCDQGCAESWTVDVADFDPQLTTGQVETLLTPLLEQHEDEHAADREMRSEVERRFIELLDRHDGDVDEICRQLLRDRLAMEQSLLNLCNNEWLRRRDRYMQLHGARRITANPAGAVEHAATDLRLLLQRFGATGETESYRQWMVDGRDGVAS